MDNLGGLLRYPISELPFVFLALLFAFTLHEYAHAYLADKFGDPTPRSMGRVTLDPRVHLDVLGTILIFIVGFGWAKPVLINPSRFKRRRLMNIIVSFAGPFANLLICFVGMFIFYLLDHLNMFTSMSHGASTAIIHFLYYLIKLNIMLFIFNLLPLPPLDGYRILYDLLPLNSRAKLQKYEQWAVYLFLLFVFLPPLYNRILGPIFSLSYPITRGFADLLELLFGPSLHIRIILGII